MDKVLKHGDKVDILQCNNHNKSNRSLHEYSKLDIVEKLCQKELINHTAENTPKLMVFENDRAVKKVVKP